MSIGIVGRFVGIFVFVFTIAIPAKPTWADEALTTRNKAVVRDFYTTVLIGRESLSARFKQIPCLHRTLTDKGGNRRTCYDFNALLL